MLLALVRDLLALQRTCGCGTTLRYLIRLTWHFQQCLKTRSLRPADLAMGPGPFSVKRNGRCAKVSGHPESCVITLIREIWGRDEYLNHGYLTIPDKAVVVDLGANIGAFSLLALTSATSVQLLAVEPNSSFNECLRQNLTRNGYLGQTRICQAFVGEQTAIQKELLKKPEYRHAGNLSGADLIRDHALHRIDLLKCDIEGSEFSLFRDGTLLGITKQIAMEAHLEAGPVEDLVSLLRTSGFEVCLIRNTSTTAVICARRPAEYRTVR